MPKANSDKAVRPRNQLKEERAWPRVLAMICGVLLLIIFGLLLVVYVVHKTNLGQTREIRSTHATLAVWGVAKFFHPTQISVARQGVETPFRAIRTMRESLQS